MLRIDWQGERLGVVRVVLRRHQRDFYETAAADSS